MTSPGIQARKRFDENMQKIAVGATLARKRRGWTVISRRFVECGAVLTLQHGRRKFTLRVPISHWGPDLADVGLNSASLPPEQRALSGF